jgi:hypothetical protein
MPDSFGIQRATDIRACLNRQPLAETYLPRQSLGAVMTDWRDTMVDRPETDVTGYVAGWTISGLAVLGTIVAIWVFGI